MGINRPSLYAAFGNKESLFRRVMDRYAERGRALVAAARPSRRRGRSSSACSAALTDRCTALPGPTGCFLVQGAMKCSASADPIRRAAAARRRGHGDRPPRPLRAGGAGGRTAADVDPADLAGYFAVVIHGMAVRAADGADRAALHRAVDIALRAWPGGGKQPKRGRQGNGKVE